MGDQLHQMTVEYVAAEDRLLFRVNTTGRLEYQMWFTRRVVAGMWKVMLGAFAQTPDVASQPAARVKKAIMSIQHQEAVSGADFATERETEVTSAPGMESPMLVTAVTCKKVDEHVCRLSFRTAAGKVINFNLTQDMMHALCHMVRRGTEKAQWKLGLTVGDAAAAGSPPPVRVVH